MQLLKDRNLNIAMFISASWHLICILFVAPVLISSNIKGDVTTISFLGSILDRVIAISEKQLILKEYPITQFLEPSQEQGSIYIKLAQPITFSKDLPEISDKEKSIMSWDKYKERAGKVHYSDKERPKIRFRDILVMGAAKNRMLLYRPGAPDKYFIPYYFSSDFSVTIKFKISRHGYVKSTECIASSGFPSIDQGIMRYLRRWQFVPDEREQEGLIRLSSERL